MEVFPCPFSIVGCLHLLTSLRKLRHQEPLPGTSPSASFHHPSPAHTKLTIPQGSKVYLPIHVPGAKFSVGDLHFSQGDGEISFCGAIEMAGVITINFSVLKAGVSTLGIKSPVYIPGPVEPQFGPGRMLYFEGFSVDHTGRQRTSYPSP